MDEVTLALNLAAAIPSLIAAYQKLFANNQNAGLVPPEDLLADALLIGQQIEAKADAELAQPNPTPLTAPDA